MRYRTLLLVVCVATGMSSATAYSAQTFLYVANAGAQSISPFTVSSISGALTPLPGFFFAVGDSLNSLAVDPAGRFAYGVSGDTNSVYAYTINPATGALTAVSGSPFRTGSQPASVAVDPTGRFVYVANAITNNISAYTINSRTGALSELALSPFASGAYPTSITVDPTGQFVYAANLNSNNVSAFTIDQSAGSLTSVAGSPFPAGSLPSSAATDPAGRFLYVANNSGSVSAYLISPATGALTAVSGSPFVAQSRPQSVTVDPTDRFVYVTNSGSNNLSAYTIDTNNGALTPVAGSPFASGTGPNSVAIDPTGQHSYVTNATDGDLWVYAIDQGTGALASGSPVPVQLTPDSAVTAIVNGPILGITKSHVGSFTQGQSGITYTVTVSNTGAGSTTGVVAVAERVPTGLTLVSMAGDGWTCPGGGVICTRADPLASGMSFSPISVVMNVAGTAPPSVTNIVSVSGIGSATALAIDTAAVVELPALSISSSHSANFYQGEMDATYSIMVSDTGSASTSGMVTVTEAVPGGLTLVSLAGNGWTCAGDGTCNRNDSLLAGASYPAITATVNVANKAPESVTNQVGVAGGSAPPANYSDVTIIPQPVLSIAKSHTGNVTQGQRGAAYSVIVSNGQPVPASTVSASSTTVTIGNSACDSSQSITLTSSGASTSFTVAVNYPNGAVHRNWLVVAAGSGSTSNTTTFSSSTGTNGVTLIVALNLSIGSVSDMAQVIVTPANPAGPPLTITVFYVPNASCSGNSGSANNGFISLTPANVSLTASSSGQQSETLTIQNITGSAAAFNYSVAPGNTWLSAQANSTTLAPGATAAITITANASQTAGAGVYVGSLTVTPQSGFGGSALNIPVTFAVTSGGVSSSGTFTINGAANTTYTASLDYVAPVPSPAQCIPIQDTATGANSYLSQVTTTTGGSWLLANNQISTTTLRVLAPGAGACVNLTLSNLASTLNSGAYQGQVALTSSSGSTATIYVNLYVSSGGAPGITVTPGLIYVFENVPSNGSVIQQQMFSISAASGYTMLAVSLTSAADGFSITTPVVSNNIQTFTVISNSTGLTAGVYFTTVTLSSTFNGQQNLTTITLALPVGQAGVTSSGTNTSTVGPSAVAFQQQQGSTYWTSAKEGQAITITGTPGAPWTASIGYTSGAAWLTFDTPSSGTLGNASASLIVNLLNGVTNLSPSSTPYQATIDIVTPTASTTVPVTLLVTPPDQPILLGSPAAATFSTTTGVNPSNQTVSVVGSDNTESTTSPTIFAGAPTANWLTASISGNTMAIGVTSTGLSNGVYAGTIPVSAGAYSNAIDYPVTLVVSPASAGPLTLSATAMSFTNVISPASQILNVTAGNPTQFSVSSSETTCTSANWLQVVSATYTASSTNTALIATVNPAGIAIGATCAGTIQLVSTSPQTVSVAMTVGAAGNGVIATTGPVTVTENVPDGLTLVSMAGSGWSCPPNGNTCARNDSLGGGASFPAITVLVNVATNASPTVTNGVTVTGGGSAAEQTSDPATILPLPALTISEAHTGNFSQGETGATYTATVSNGTSSIPASQPVTVTEIVPSFLTLVSLAGSGWSCPANGNTCTRSDSLAAGMSYPPITVTVDVAGNAAASVVNQVNVSYSGWMSPNATDPTTIVPVCALSRGPSASLADIQRVINEALGITQAVDDLNADGVVNAADLQIVINAVLGLGCSL